MWERSHILRTEDLIMRGLVVYGDGTVRLKDDISMPVINDYSAIVKTIACGICNGTDIKLVEGHLKGFSDYPAVLGHESVGIVTEVGSKVTKFKVGDYVLRSQLDPDAKYNSLWGSFAEYTRVYDYEAQERDNAGGNIGDIPQQVIPSGLDMADATMIITLKEVYSALKRLGLKEGDSIVIAGDGPVGLAFANCARIYGASKIILTGHHNDRLSTALNVGADLALNSKTNPDYLETIKEELPGGADVFVDAVGNNHNVNDAFALIRDNGTIGLYGIGIKDDIPVKWKTAPYNFKFLSVQWPIPEIEASIHDELIENVVNGNIDLKDYVSDVLPVEEFEKGFELVRSRKGLKVVLTF